MLFFSRNGKRPLYLITGADSTHAKSLLQFLASARKHERRTRIVVYDLGLTKAQRKDVLNECHNGSVERFPYEHFPAFFDIKVKAGEYAWKPVIIAMEMAKSLDPVCWMDAGNVIHSPLRRLRDEIASRGFYSGPSLGTVRDWIHPGMLSMLAIPNGLYSDRPILNAACVGFDPLVPQAAALAAEWAHCALKREIIAPPGSDRSNHRQDQALLTILAYRSKIIDAP